MDNKNSFTFNFNAPVGQNIAHADKVIVNFDKDMKMQILDTDEISNDKDEEDIDEEEDKKIINELTSCFYSNRQEAEIFLIKIRSMKTTDITNLVKQLISSKKISDISCHRKLYSILNKYGLYDKSESNWNSRIK